MAYLSRQTRKERQAGRGCFHRRSGRSHLNGNPVLTTNSNGNALPTFGGDQDTWNDMKPWAVASFAFWSCSSSPKKYEMVQVKQSSSEAQHSDILCRFRAEDALNRHHWVYAMRSSFVACWSRGLGLVGHSIPRQPPSFLETVQVVGEEAVLCLPCLWSDWHHRGRLTAAFGMCTLVTLDVEDRRSCPLAAEGQCSMARSPSSALLPFFQGGFPVPLLK